MNEALNILKPDAGDRQRELSSRWRIGGMIGLIVGLLSICPADAGAAVTSTNNSGTITAGNTWQTLLMAGSGSRVACQLQNPLYLTNGAVNTSPLFVAVQVPLLTLQGLSINAAQAYAFQLSPGGSYNCADGSGVEQSVLNITGPTTGQPFIFTSQ